MIYKEDSFLRVRACPVQRDAIFQGPGRRVTQSIGRALQLGLVVPPVSSKQKKKERKPWMKSLSLRSLFRQVQRSICKVQVHSFAKRTIYIFLLEFSEGRRIVTRVKNVEYCEKIYFFHDLCSLSATKLVSSKF